MNHKTGRLINKFAFATDKHARTLRQQWLAAPAKVRAGLRREMKRIFEEQKKADDAAQRLT